MMRLRLSLKSLARCGLKICLLLFFICGCSTSTIPTYCKSDIEKSIQKVLLGEYKLEIKTKLVGQTLWLYLPLKDLFEKAKKPEKYTERFQIAENENEFKYGALKLNYLVKSVPENEKSQDYKFSKNAMEDITNVWEVLRRVIFSVDRKTRDEIKFYYLIVSDIKNGYEIRELIYYQDMSKVTYRFISPGEYQHRVSYDSGVSVNIIGDKEGKHLEYRDIPLEEFIAKQIKHRINLKFQKPEVKHNADIDQEIVKIIIETLKIYDFKDIDTAELNNLLTNTKRTLSRGEIFSSSMD